MVERLVAAGREVLVETGYDGFSTNRVASRAGVSPGSLYQYFPDKTALIDEVIERWAHEVSDRVAGALADRVGGAEPGSTLAVMDALVAALEADAVLLRVVLEELPASRHASRRQALETRVTELAAAYFAGVAAASGARPSADPATLAWVVVLATENLAVRWVLDRPAGVPREVLVRELARLATGYLGVLSEWPRG